MNKGFDRLKGVAAASIVGLGTLCAGSARAAAVSTGVTYRLTYNSSVAWGGAVFAPSGIANIATGPLTVQATSWASGAGFYLSGLGNITWLTLSRTTSGGFAVQNGSSTNFAIGEAGIHNVSALTNSTASAVKTAVGVLSDAFDGAMIWTVDGWLFKNPDATADFTNNLLSAGTMVDIIPGVNAQASLYFHPTRAVARSVMALTNTSSADITTTATVMGRVGSGLSTLIEASSNGDLVNDDADMWVVSSDTPLGIDAVTVGGAAAGDPIITTTRYGSNATVMPRVSSARLGAGPNKDSYYYHYDLTIPAGKTIRVMMFHEMSNTIASAVAGAADFESAAAANNAGMLAGMTEAEKIEVVNYKYVAPVAPASDSGATGLAALLALFGVPALLRRFRKEKTDA